MKKVFLLLSIFVVFLSCDAIRAQQVVQSVKDNYQPNVVAEVFDLVAKTALDEEDQIAAAKIIHQRDSAVNVMIQTGRSVADIALTRNTYANLLNDLLSPQQKYKTFVKTKQEQAKRKYTYSQFAIAMRYKDSLDLSAIQIQALHHQIDTLKKIKNAHYELEHKSLDTRAYESAHISQILTQEQYDKLLSFKNQSKALAFAESDWMELVQRGLDSTYTKAVVVTQLTNYYLARESAYNKYQHDLVRQKSEARAVYYDRPAVLRTLERARRSPQNNTQNSNYPWGN